MPTVFYAWQSDRDEDVCHYFIRDCAAAAIEQLKQEADATADTQVEEADAPSSEDDDLPNDVELDHDTKGVAGTPNIAETIKQKTATCAIFIADLTHVALYTTADGRKKQAQNGNVLIELGLALQTKPLDRILLVMNTAFGSWTSLPFDLRLYRRPIRYNLPNKSNAGLFMKAAEELTADLKAALKPMLAAYARQQREADRRDALAGRNWADEQWRSFQQTFQNDFRGLTKGGAYFAAAIIPMKQPAKPLDLLSLEEKIQKDATPIGSRGYNTDAFGRSVVNSDSMRPRHNRAAEAPNTVTEVTDSGCVFAAVNLIPGGWGELRQIPLQDDERMWIVAIEHYVTLLRELGVTGPFILRMMLTGVENCYMLPRDYQRYNDRDFRPLTISTFTFDPAVIDVGSVAKRVRPLFNVLWRDAGFQGDLALDEEGNFL